ncbi:MAG TPA: ELWxxDGT repeat protein [Thermoanaerobaculia bacterium]|nr:ELWxxDGT repeat protein [Thermoanaerobaculia bacterium]
MRGEWIAKAFVLLTLTAQPGGAAEAPRLLKDIVTQPGPALNLLGLPEGFVQVNDRLVFSTPTGNFDFSDPGILWSTDGTAEGTQALSTAICPVFCESITPVATWPGVALLRTTEKIDPGESAFKMRLWRTDGTPAGTFPLTEATETTQIVGAFVEGSSPGVGLFYFFDCPSPQECRLWRSDGTRPGTHAVTDLKLSRVVPMPAAGRFYFLAESDAGTGLWITDGTENGTQLLAAIPIYGGSGLFAATPTRLFFITAEALWVSDGTPGGTRSVVSADQNDFLEPVGETVYFLGGDIRAPQIWRSDGTESGTGPLTEIPQSDYDVSSLVLGRAGSRWLFTFPNYKGPLWTAGENFSDPALLTCPEGCPGIVWSGPFAKASPPGRLLFTGQDAQHGWELWVSDGTGRGTRRLTDVCPGECEGLDPNSLVASRLLGKTYFQALDVSQKVELWVTDGTLGSTRRIATAAAFAPDLGSLGNLVFFGMTNSKGTTSELWVTDGTPAGKRRVATLGTLAGSYPLFAPLDNGALIFGGEDHDDLQTLWRTDGTPERTVPLPGFEGSYAVDLTRVGELTFFVGDGPQSPYEKVWRTDGTTRGTFPVARLPNSFVDLNIAWNGKYLFAVSGPSDGCAYWLSDGTILGTREIIPELAGSRCPTGIHALGSRFVFIERVPGDGGLTPQVFVSDGTAAGTRQISNIPGPRDFINTDLAEIGGVIFFRLNRQDGQDAEVWRTDGSPEGTYRLPLALSQPDALFAFQGSLYLTAAVDAASPPGFWRVPLDGSPPVLLTAASPTFHAFTPAGGRLFFAASDATHGAELWVTDGSPAGTRMVRDIQPGAPSSAPDWLAAAGNRVFFAADDGVSGRELWVSDGTAEGTRLVWDLNPGLLSSSPYGLTVAGGYLFFGADDGKTGVEPWALKLEP